MYSEYVELDLVDRRAEPRRTQASPGPRVALGRARRLPRRARSRAQRGPRRGDRRAPARRRGRRGRDHVVHEHLEPRRCSSPRASSPSAPWNSGSSVEALGQDVARPGQSRRHGLPRARRARRAARRSSASTSPGYGCTTCIGNTGPLLDGVSEAVNEHDLSVVSVLSGNRNFEGRIHPDVKQNFLASPPLVVAYALAGTIDIDLTNEPLGTDAERRAGVPGGPLADATPRSPTRCARRSRPEMFEERYAERLQRRRALAAACPTTNGGHLRLGPQVHLREAPPVLRRPHDGAGRRRGHRRRARARQAGRLGHDRPHLARRQHPAQRRPPAAT